MTRLLNKIGAWIFFSSKDSTKISLTIKSVFAVVALLAGVFQIPMESLTGLQDSTITLVNSVLVSISAIGVFIGAVRKVKTTLLGTNAVVNDPQL